jgi:hypothetical protein
MPEETNPLREWAQNYATGPGVWKWDTYYDIYHRFFSKFRGREVHVCEVGVYSGGSLKMWRDYFGDQCTVYGVDIQPACAKYETDWCHIYIGDQGDPNFWKWFRGLVPRVDVFIDDGSHVPQHQNTTMQEMLPHLSPGGVYCCEDILGERNPFAISAGIMTMDLHPNVDIHATDMLAMGMTPFQRMVQSMHFYAHVLVIEKWLQAPERFQSPMRGSEWIHFDPTWRG